MDWERALAALGEVIAFHIDDEFLLDGRFDTARAHSLARCGYQDYAAVEKLFADALFHNETSTSEADLASVVVHERRLLHREIEIGVGVDHERSLSAKFSGERHEIACGNGANASPGFGRSGEGDPANARI